MQVARALAQGAAVLILDEPTASLDFGNARAFCRSSTVFAASGLAIVFSTHEPDHALAHADRALLLADGRPLALDTVERALTAENVGRLYRVRVPRRDGRSAPDRRRRLKRRSQALKTTRPVPATS